MNYGLAYKQAHEMQQVLYQIVMDDKATPSTKASCARVWALLQDSRRIIRGKPLPGQLRPELEQKRKRKLPLLAESLEPVEEVSPFPEMEAPRTSASTSPVVAETSQPQPTPAKPTEPAICVRCDGTGILRFRGGNYAPCPDCNPTGRWPEPRV